MDRPDICPGIAPYDPERDRYDRPARHVVTVLTLRLSALKIRFVASAFHPMQKLDS